MDKDILERPPPPPAAAAAIMGKINSSSRIVSTSSIESIASTSAFPIINATPSSCPSAPSSEQCALINFAYRLGSVVKNNDSDIATIDDVRKEAKLLMSLSYNSAAASLEDDHQHQLHHAVQILPHHQQRTMNTYHQVVESLH